jgi:hypothetical protein
MLTVLGGNSASTGYNLTRSLRFRASASASLSRTPSVAGNRQKFTVSVWYKAGIISTPLVNANILGSGDGSSLLISGSGAFGSTVNDRLIFRDGGGTTTLYWPMVFRDTASWYHIVFAMDTTQATAANRAKLYVNGVDQGAFSGSAPAQNTNTTINSTSLHTINSFNGTFYYSDLYYAEYNFVDGQQLTASSFGSTNVLTGVWQPAPYSGGSYGTNGFYLPFTDNSALTTSSNVGLGKDFSGNGNYWTTNNISITSGVTYDSMTDVPTLTSATAANFCVANPLDKQTDIAVAQGNLQISTSAGAGNKQIRGSIALPSAGKFYWETRNTGSTNNFNMGLTTFAASLSTEGAGDMFYNEGGVIGNNGTNTSGYPTLALNDIVGVAVDIDANKIYWYKNNTLVNSGGTTINITAPFAPMFGLYDNGNAQSITFGQRPFAYTPPTGFVALNTYNLPTATIVKGNTVMDATLYTGNTSTQTVTNAGGFKPDLVWLKSRNQAYQHGLFDSVRGSTKGLVSNSTAAEATFNSLTSFNSNGFSLNTDYNDPLAVGANYVAWQWQAGQGTTSSNTNGTITSTVSVNASAGFSVVTYTGTGSAATVGHGLGVAPSLIIVKRRNSTANWNVYHTSVGATGVLLLNLIDTTATTSVAWNNTAPTSSVFTVGTGNDVNASGGTFVAYCFASIAGFSSFSNYTGNGSTDGVFVYTGFRPKFVMIKRTNVADDWYINDTIRDPSNVTGLTLLADSSNAEANYSPTIDILSNGFKIRQSGAGYNASGGNYVYTCWAETPFKNALAR